VRLSVADVIRSGPPSIDPRGLYFEFDERIFRAFRGTAATLFRRLLGADWVTDLFDAGLVRFTASDVTLEGYDLVVEVERIPIVTYPPEWPTAMLRRAGVRIGELGVALARHRLGYVDGHPWNVLFDASTAKYVDLGSIIESDAVTPAIANEFRRYVVLPLFLHRMKMHGLADEVQRFPDGGLIKLFDGRFVRTVPFSYRQLRRYFSDPVRFYSHVVEHLTKEQSLGTSSYWTSYYPSTEPSVGDQASYTEKHRSMDALFGRLPKGRVLDVGANAGWYSILATHYGHDVVALDLDDRELSRLHEVATRDRLSILPLRIDFMRPPGSSGLGLEYRPSPQRLRSDTVVVLAVLHHLTAFQGITFEAFAKVVDMFTRKHAIVEFVPAEDVHVAKWRIAGADWYDRSTFVDAMKPYFEIVDALPSAPHPREILVFEKR
jgi:SAM-dependent methyltransferase